MTDEVNDTEVIKTSELTFSYSQEGTDLALGLTSGHRFLIHRLALSIGAGELLFLIGPTGVGKTTLLKMLAGILSPISGSLWIQGAPTEHMRKREKKLIFRRVAMTFQRSGLFDSKTVLENLLFPLEELTELDSLQRNEMAKKALKQVGLEGSETRFPFELSGGMQKRLGIARVLVLQPQIILYDDPTAGLDPITSSQILNLIVQFHQERRTTSVIATSDLELATAIGQATPSRFAFLYQGEILESGSWEKMVHSQHPVIYQFIRGLVSGPLSDLENL